MRPEVVISRTRCHGKLDAMTAPRRRRRIVLPLVGTTLLATLGGGGWAAYQYGWMSGKASQEPSLEQLESGFADARQVRFGDRLGGRLDRQRRRRDCPIGDVERAAAGRRQSLCKLTELSRRLARAANAKRNRFASGIANTRSGPRCGGGRASRRGRGRAPDGRLRRSTCSIACRAGTESRT